MEINNTQSSNYISRANEALAQNSERIASGSRINSAADDAAGFAISESLTRQIDAYGQSIRNANDGISYLQTADAGLSSINEGLERIRELSLQASNGILNDSDREALNGEAQQIRDEIQRSVESTNFNGRSVLSGNESLSLQVGSQEDDQLEIELDDVSRFLEDFENIDLSTAAGAQSAVSVVDELQDNVTQVRSEIGAGLNRLDSSINNLSQSELSAQESRSRISDADIAREVSELTLNQIKRDASIAIQVQANQRGSSLLDLLS